MSSITVTSSVACEACGGTAERAFGERVADGKLSSWLSTKCEHCSSFIESDAEGPLTADQRALLLAQTGARALLIETDDAVPVLARLRETLELELPALMALKRDLPGPIFRGSTPGEAELIRSLLADLAEVVVVPDAPRTGMTAPPAAPDNHRLRFFFDAGCGTCLWAATDPARALYGYAVEARALPIAPDLAERLAALVAEYDTSIDWADPASAGPWSATQRQDFHERASALLAELRSALGPEYEVVDERAALSDAEG